MEKLTVTGISVKKLNYMLDDNKVLQQNRAFVVQRSCLLWNGPSIK